MKDINRLKEKLKTYAKLLLNNGFRVFVYEKDKKLTWFIFEKNNQLGSVQLSDWDNFQFSTKHKPNLRTGTGYLLNYNEILNPTIENAEKTFINYPNWADKKDFGSVIKYKSIDEYLKSEQVLKYVEIKL